jgi:hypothetical protein
MRSRLAILLALAVLIGLAAARLTRRGDRVRILFIGNSLTTTNGLPAMVQALASAQGDRLECQTVAFPNYSLEDHWTRGDAARTIEKGGWSFVVLQQGPSALPESRVLLREYVRRFNQVIQPTRAKTAVYMVWPSAARRQDFDRVSESYTLAAADVHGLLLPVGDAWRAAWRRDRLLPLYSSDGFHPSAMGSYLAALVIYERVSGRSHVVAPSQLTSVSGAFPPIVLSAERAILLQSAGADGAAGPRR